MSTAYCNNRAAAASAARASAAAAAASAEEEECDYEEFNPYLFIKLLPPYPSVVPRAARVVMPRKQPRAPPVSLVLDLDETLVHCSCVCAEAGREGCRRCLRRSPARHAVLPPTHPSAASTPSRMPT